MRRKALVRGAKQRGREADTTHQVYNSFKLKLSHTCTHTRSAAPHIYTHTHTHTYIYWGIQGHEQLERKNNIFVAFSRCVTRNQRRGATEAQPWGEVRLLVSNGWVVRGEWGKGAGTRSVGHPVFAAADGEENSRTNAMCPSPRKKNTCQATAQHKRPKVPGLQHFRNI